MPVAAAEYTVSRTYLDWLVALPWTEAHRRGHRPQAHQGRARRRPLRPREGQGPHPRVPRRPQAQPRGEGADPLLRRPAGRRQDLAGQVDRQRARPQVRPHLAGRHARRGRDPRPPPHLHRRAARPDHPGAAPRRVEEPGVHARRDRQARRPTSAATRRRRCSRCSTPSRTTPSATTTSTCRSTCPRCCSSPRPTCSTRSRRRCATAWRCSSSPGYTEEEKLKIARSTWSPSRCRTTASRPSRSSSPRQALRAVIRGYTREAGVRNLEREIAAALPQGGPPPRRGRRRIRSRSRPDVVVEMLGAPKVLEEEMEERTKNPGVAVGLAWTPAGRRGALRRGLTHARAAAA